MKKNQLKAYGIVVLILPFFYSAFIAIDATNILPGFLSMLLVITGVILAIIIGTKNTTTYDNHQRI